MAPADSQIYGLGQHLLDCPDRHATSRVSEPKAFRIPKIAGCGLSQRRKFHHRLGPLWVWSSSIPADHMAQQLASGLANFCFCSRR